MNKIGIFMNFWEKNWAADHLKYIRKASMIGFDILEFQADPLLHFSSEKLCEIRKEAEDRGIELTYSLGLAPEYDISSNDAQIRKNGVEYLKKIVETVGSMNGKVISGVSYARWGAPDYILNDKSEMQKRSIESMRQVVRTAEEFGVKYCVEAVNRFEGAIINTAAEAVAYAKQVESPYLGILLDTFHMNIEENNMGEAIRQAGVYLSNFHMGDNNRRAPGRGHINFDEIFNALKDIEYTGRIVNEPFVMMGGEVGRDIRVWRNLDNPTEETIDQEATYLLRYERDMLVRYGFQ